MVECEICGADVSGGSAFTCTYCGGTFCPTHRLPFNHVCPRIDDWKSARLPVKKQKSRMKGTPLPVDQRSLIAGGVIMLFLIILFLWIFRMI